MKQQRVSQTLGRVAKIVLAPLSPFQYFLDSPGLTHNFCIIAAFNTLGSDGKEDVINYYDRFLPYLNKGLFWADKGWKNVCHYYNHQSKQGLVQWPGAVAEFQYYFNKALIYNRKNITKSMFYLGAALHIVQDMSVPHHSVGVIFDGHQEFENWAENNFKEFIVNSNGLYLSPSHPTFWVHYNAEISKDFYSLVSLEKGANEKTFSEAASYLLPLTIRTTAGFLAYAKEVFMKI